MTLHETLRYARRRADLTQQQVAERAGLTQPFVATLEAGRGNPTLETVRRWAQAVDMDVVGVAAGTDPVQDAARALHEVEGPVAFRIALELLDRLRETDSADLPRVVTAVPPPTGAGRLDALLAAVVDHVCGERGVPSPAWCDGPVADPTWWVSPLPSARRHALATSPAAFRARGIMIDEADLARA